MMQANGGAWKIFALEPPSMADAAGLEHGGAGRSSAGDPPGAGVATRL